MRKMVAQNRLLATGAGDVASMVRDKIKGALLELMPAEEWDKLIKTEMDRFLSPQNRNGQREPSQLTSLVRAIVKEHFNERLREYMERELFSDLDYEVNFGEVIGQATKAYAAELGRSFFGTVIRAMSGLAGLENLAANFSDAKWCSNCQTLVQGSSQCPRCQTWVS